ncbi:MAG TPA: YdcF family protein [Candidatus Limnocylindria bacterium]|nr:YdcF family protein [Candidatus Limnocylindria bacterium]
MPTPALIRSLARGFALFLTGFILLNQFLLLRTPGLDANLWWVDLRWLPTAVAQTLLAALAIALAGQAFRPAQAAWRRHTTLGLVLLFVALTLINATVFWRLLAGGDVTSQMPLPGSLVFAAMLGIIAWDLRQSPAAPAASPRWLPSLAVALGCAAAFPVLQVFCFGKTDYRRTADAAVVFGARVYADGRLSDAVADRVSTACQLYRGGFVKRLVFSGGPGDGLIHETEAMRMMALRLGVPPAAITLDREGLNTEATVRNTTALAAQARVLAVSEFYHLPRIKLAYQRAGCEVFTVPARPANWLRAWPLNSVLREIPAFWVYYGRGLAHL